MRKFADRQTKNNQAKNSSNTEATLILCGSSGEWANTSKYFYQYDVQYISVLYHTVMNSCKLY